MSLYTVNNWCFAKVRPEKIAHKKVREINEIDQRCNPIRSPYYIVNRAFMTNTYLASIAPTKMRSVASFNWAI